MEVLGLITARGGSKGLPRKNVLLVAGRPMIAWTIEAALESRALRRVVVSTDDEEIAEVSRRWGAEVPFLRPAELAQDGSSHFSTVVHALRWLESHEGAALDYIMLLQPTSPLRTAKDIEAAVDVARKKRADSVISVSASPAHPYQVRRIVQDGTLEEFVPGSPPPGVPETRRQDFPAAYHVNGAIYLIRREVLLQYETFEPPNTFPYVMPSHRSLQIDEPWDLRVANLIFGDRDDSSFN